ncbi:MAG: guanylate kinase [Syntrophomonadaceae bacterium]|jgi:guanylate kinase
MSKRGRLVLLGGPSCVGKGPLCNALKVLYPAQEGKLRKLVMYNTRDPRPGETEGVDYYFRSRDEIQRLNEQDDFILLEVRGDLQGLDTAELFGILDGGQDVLFEGNPYVPRAIWNLPEMAEVDILKVFLSPLSKAEIMWLKSRGVNVREMLIDVMRRKLLRRTQKQKGLLSLRDLENIEKRCGSAPLELELAWQFDWIIPNHDGEDSDNWNAFYYPLADALQAVETFAALLQNQPAPYAEKWDQQLWP